MTMGHNIYINDYHKLIERSGPFPEWSRWQTVNLLVLGSSALWRRL